MTLIQTLLGLSFALIVSTGLACRADSQQAAVVSFKSDARVQNGGQATATSQSFEIELRPKDKLWNSRRPLVLDVSFRNTGERSLRLNLRSAFQFYGFLEDDAGHVFGIEWTPKGAERMPRSDDYVEIPPGGTFLVTLTSTRVRSETAEKMIPWRAHKPGLYTLYLQFASGSKTYLMPDQWEGIRRSDEVRLSVR